MISFTITFAVGAVTARQVDTWVSTLPPLAVLQVALVVGLVVVHVARCVWRVCVHLTRKGV